MVTAEQPLGEHRGHIIHIAMDQQRCLVATGEQQPRRDIFALVEGIDERRADEDMAAGENADGDDHQPEHSALAERIARRRAHEAPGGSNWPVQALNKVFTISNWPRQREILVGIFSPAG